MDRVQKILAAAGYGSRRECEEFIKEGRVKVNGEIAELGQKADPDQDDIQLDGRSIASPEPRAYYMLYKPIGVLSSLESQGGYPTVDDLVPAQERVYPVGRLDVDSEGLILLTNDGDLTHRLTHPRFEHDKEYLVWLDRLPSEEALTHWRRGLDLPGLGRAAPAEVSVEDRDQGKLRVIMHEGMNRQIRVTAETLGARVLRLKRIRLGTLELGDLEVGDYRRLRQAEVDELRQLVGLSVVQEDGG